MSIHMPAKQGTTVWFNGDVLTVKMTGRTPAAASD